MLLYHELEIFQPFTGVYIWSRNTASSFLKHIFANTKLFIYFLTEFYWTIFFHPTSTCLLLLNNKWATWLISKLSLFSSRLKMLKPQWKKTSLSFRRCAVLYNTKQFSFIKLFHCKLSKKEFEYCKEAASNNINTRWLKSDTHKYI